MSTSITQGEWLAALGSAMPTGEADALSMGIEGKTSGGCLYKRRNTWWFQTYLNGKSVRMSLGIHASDDAEGRRDYVRKQLSAPLYLCAPSVAAAVLFLERVVRGIPQPAWGILHEARKQGISRPAIQIAKARLGIKSIKVGFGKNARWDWLAPSKDSLYDTSTAKVLMLQALTASTMPLRIEPLRRMGRCRNLVGDQAIRELILAGSIVRRGTGQRNDPYLFSAVVPAQ